ncbi:hypothetical protein WAI453_012598 [Rhynchosporium graminicola]
MIWANPFESGKKLSFKLLSPRASSHLVCLTFRVEFPFLWHLKRRAHSRETFHHSRSPIFQVQTVLSGHFEPATEASSYYQGRVDLLDLQEA